MLIISRSLFGERKYSHAIPPVSMVSVEVCWVSIMTVLSFLSSVLSTRLGPAKMCSSIPGKLGDPDVVRLLTNWETYSQYGNVFFFHPRSPRFVDELLDL